MPKQQEQQGHEAVNLNESSVYGPDAQDSAAAERGDTATGQTLDRLERMTGGAEDPVITGGRLQRETEKYEAANDEEIDALLIDLLQEDDRPDAQNGSGRVADDVAREQLAELTEVGADLQDEGARSLSPGREDTSALLQRHFAKTEAARADDALEGNLEQPRDEERGERKVKEGTAS